MTLLMAGLGGALLLGAVLLLVSRRGWPAWLLLLLLSFLPFATDDNFARALFTWLALAGLCVMLAVLARGLTSGLAERPDRD